MDEQTGVKGLFFTVAHEILSPIHNINAFADLTITAIKKQGGTGFSATVMEGHQRHIKREVKGVVTRLERLAELMDCELREGEALTEPVCVIELLERITSNFQIAAAARRTKIYIHGVKPFRFGVDVRKLGLIVSNLVENAVYATRDGRIDVSARIREKPLRLVIDVRDTGTGIPLDRQEKVFERFTKWIPLDQEPERACTGLGLPIARGLAEMMGGAITLESAGTEGLGSCFTLDLPIPRARSVSLDP